MGDACSFHKLETFPLPVGSEAYVFFEQTFCLCQPLVLGIEEDEVGRFTSTIIVLELQRLLKTL